MAEKEFIPVCEPLLSGNELEYVQQAVSTGWISSSGGFVTEFEEKFARFCGSRYGVTTNTGTAALLGEITTAAFTFNPHITRRAHFDQGFDEFRSGGCEVQIRDRHQAIEASVERGAAGAPAEIGACRFCPHGSSV